MSDAPLMLVPVREQDLKIGTPLPWTIYDWKGNVLHASGHVLASREQRDRLVDNGFIHDAMLDSQPAKAAARTREPVPAAANGQAEATILDQQHPPPAEHKANKETLMDMGDAKWLVGETLYLQLADNSSIRYTVHLIGYVKNKTVFVTAPAVDGKFEFVREGQAFVVRAFVGKKAFAFMSSAVKSVFAPHPYLHLSYPKDMRCTTVRSSLRAQVKLVAALAIDGTGMTCAGMLTDLSTGGASVVTKQPFGAKGQQMQVKFKLHVEGFDEFLNLRAVLRSITPAEQGDGFRNGFEFVDSSVKERLILSAFVHQALVDAA